ncbi:hypothetical protein D3C73_880930 [compost metagenome]
MDMENFNFSSFAASPDLFSGASLLQPATTLIAKTLSPNLPHTCFITPTSVSLVLQAMLGSSYLKPPFNSTVCIFLHYSCVSFRNTSLHVEY